MYKWGISASGSSGIKSSISGSASSTTTTAVAPRAGGAVCAMDTHALTMDWYPTAGSSRGHKGGGSEVFAAGGADGSVRIIGRHGRVEAVAKSAHTGAVTCVRWNHEGTALATVGEDAAVRIWSSDLTERSRLSAEIASDGDKAASGVYCCCWSGDGDAVLLAHGKFLVVKSIGSGGAGAGPGASKQQRWKAHEGAVLACDWNPVNNTIVSGGEDCRYKVCEIVYRCLCENSVSPRRRALFDRCWAEDLLSDAHIHNNEIVLHYSLRA